jgi:hypothetical protein
MHIITTGTDLKDFMGWGDGRVTPSSVLDSSRNSDLE